MRCACAKKTYWRTSIRTAGVSGSQTEHGLSDDLQNCRDIPRLEAGRWLRRRARLLQSRQAGGNPGAGVCAHAGAVWGRGGGRRAVRGEEKIRRLTGTLEEQFTEGRKLEAAISENLKRLEFHSNDNPISATGMDVG